MMEKYKKKISKYRTKYKIVILTVKFDKIHKCTSLTFLGVNNNYNINPKSINLLVKK